MIEKKYILNEETLTFFEAYIEPQHEWCRIKSGGGEWIKIFNDINPKTGKRTGKYYKEHCVFCTTKDGELGLMKYLNELVEKNRKEISRLQSENQKFIGSISKFKI